MGRYAYTGSRDYSPYCSVLDAFKFRESLGETRLMTYVTVHDTHTHTHTHTHMKEASRTKQTERTNTNINAFVHAYVFVCVRAGVFVCVCVFVCVSARVAKVRPNGTSV